MSTKKKAVKSKKDISNEDLTKSVDGTSLVGPPKMASASLGFPILCG